MDDQVTQTSAIIIDFKAYKMNKRASAKLSQDTACFISISETIESCCLFWLCLAWVPFGLLSPPVFKRDHTFLWRS
ncbi:hypothetical protein WN73_21640 [Bradyrhizobium sp. CCBAU 45394]|uniref:hypothetical protein n=1 Tax=Bradyrhizobium sp. CCBAU 45394 TaxID=1325087 RepID=UPI00230392E5|nr:hypothetical protein [Bradyrhizobium sp. CCBAU 45394]MDA9393115.1 hypothetical protein [Bradyrhizobium sp. CCBAU 45394]